MIPESWRELMLCYVTESIGGNSARTVGGDRNDESKQVVITFFRLHFVVYYA